MKRRACLGIWRLHFLRLNQYRLSTITEIASSFFYGFIQVSILIAFYRFGRTSSIDMTMRQAVTYLWLCRALLPIAPLFEDVDLRQRIVSGGFIYDLCRPVDMYSQWFFRFLAFRTTPMIKSIPSMILIGYFLPGDYRMLPPTVEGLALAIIAAFVALLVSTALSCIISAFYMKIELGRGPVSLFLFIISFLSGMEVPLPILPAKFVEIIRWLPFAGLYDTPCSLYLGIIHPDQAMLFFVRQIVWLVILVFIGRRQLAGFLRRVIVQGG